MQELQMAQRQTDAQLGLISKQLKELANAVGQLNK